jgi:hypothetical protein
MGFLLKNEMSEYAIASYASDVLARTCLARVAELKMRWYVRPSHDWCKSNKSIQIETTMAGAAAELVIHGTAGTADLHSWTHLFRKIDAEDAVVVRVRAMLGGCYADLHRVAREIS